MKYQTTQKDVKAGYAKTICIGYCDLQHLLSYFNPVAFTCGGYGWNADIYDFGDVAIVTGYRPFGNTPAPYKLTKKYDDKARKFYDSWDIDYSKKKKKAEKLIEKFIAECVAG